MADQLNRMPPIADATTIENTAPRKKLEPKSIRKHLSENQLGALSTNANPIINTQAGVANEIAMSPQNKTAAMIANKTAVMLVNGNTAMLLDESTAPEPISPKRLNGLQRIQYLVQVLNRQTTAYIELQDEVIRENNDINEETLLGVAEATRIIYADLKEALIDLLATQSLIHVVLTMPLSDFTTDELLITAAKLRRVLRDATTNIEWIWEGVMRVEILEQLRCEPKKIVQQCLRGYYVHYNKMLKVLAEAERKAKQVEKEDGFVGPKQAEFLSLFPSRNGVALLFCGREE